MYFVDVVSLKQRGLPLMTWVNLIQSVEGLESTNWSFPEKKFCLKTAPHSCLSCQPAGIPCPTDFSLASLKNCMSQFLKINFIFWCFPICIFVHSKLNPFLCISRYSIIAFVWSCPLECGQSLTPGCNPQKWWDICHYMYIITSHKTAVPVLLRVSLLLALREQMTMMAKNWLQPLTDSQQETGALSLLIHKDECFQTTMLAWKWVLPQSSLTWDCSPRQHFWL